MITHEPNSPQLPLQGQSGVLENAPFDTMEQDQAPSIDYSTLFPAEVDDEEASRIRRIGSFMAKLPSAAYQSAQRAAVSFGTDPLHFIKQTTEGAMIAVETLPVTSAPIRYGGAAYVLVKTGNSLAAAGYLSGSTMIMETLSSLSMADVLHRGNNKAIDAATKLVDKVVPPEKKLAPLAEAVITNFAGSAPLLAAKQRENPERTRRQNIRLGLLASAGLSLAIIPQGLAISEGATNPTNPRVIVPGAAILGGFWYASRRAQRKLQTSNEEQV